jgi:hypothetical protein
MNNSNSLFPTVCEERLKIEGRGRKVKETESPN